MFTQFVKAGCSLPEMCQIESGWPGGQGFTLGTSRGFSLESLSLILWIHYNHIVVSTE